MGKHKRKKREANDNVGEAEFEAFDYPVLGLGGSYSVPEHLLRIGSEREVRVEDIVTNAKKVDEEISELLGLGDEYTAVTVLDSLSGIPNLDVRSQYARVANALEGICEDESNPKAAARFKVLLNYCKNRAGSDYFPKTESRTELK